MQTPATTPTLDTPVPMDIYQSSSRPKTSTCYNCGDKGHLSHICLKPQMQRIQLTKSAKMDIKILMDQAVAVAMDTRDVAKMVNKANKAKQVKESGKDEMDF